MKEAYNYGWAIGAPYGCLHEVKTDSGNYRQGHYVYKHGVVLVYSDDNHTSLSIYRGGRGFHQTLTPKKPYTDIGLARMAGKFAKKIMHEHPGLFIEDFTVHENATNLAWSLRITLIRQDEIDQLIIEIMRKLTDGEGWSEPLLLARLKDKLDNIQELIYAASRFDALIHNT